jgi:hypothetical protein
VGVAPPKIQSNIALLPMQLRLAFTQSSQLAAGAEPSRQDEEAQRLPGKRRLRCALFAAVPKKEGGVAPRRQSQHRPGAHGARLALRAPRASRKKLVNALPDVVTDTDRLVRPACVPGCRAPACGDEQNRTSHHAGKSREDLHGEHQTTQSPRMALNREGRIFRRC